MLIQHGRLVAFCVVLITILSLQARPAGAQITVGGSSGEVSPADPSSWGEETDAQIGIHAGKTGTVTVAGGASVSPGSSLLGYFPLSNGTVTVAGSGSSWSAPYGMYVGCFGAGTLSVTNGGTVSSYYDYIGVYGGSTGTATVSGAGSTWVNNDELQVGASGTGTLRVDSGGSVTTNAVGSIGSEFGSNGTVTITGPDSTWRTVGEVNVGYSGTGTLRVDSGGTVASSSQNFEGTYIGRDAGTIGTAVVTGPGSTWTNTTLCLTVGSDGSGTLRVEDGGKVSSVSQSVLG